MPDWLYFWCLCTLPLHFRLFVCFCITDTLALFPLVQVPLKREYNPNGNQTEFQRHSKHWAYTETTSQLRLFSEIIGDFSKERIMYSV